jgi:hypothetical protein
MSAYTNKYILSLEVAQTFRDQIRGNLCAAFHAMSRDTTSLLHKCKYPVMELRNMCDLVSGQVAWAVQPTDSRRD